MNKSQLEAQSSDRADTAVATEQLINQEVYSRTGERVGRVSDIIVDFESQRIDGLLITDANANLFTQDSIPRDFILPYEWVQDAESIVLTNPVSEERVTFK